MTNGIPNISWLGRLAHDLRGPLSPLLMAADLLAQPGLPPSDRTEMEALLKRQAKKLSAMIDELSDWGSLTEGRLIGQKLPSDVDWMLQTASGTLAPTLSGRVRIDASVEVEIEVDSHRLVQAFATLMRVRDALVPADELVVTPSSRSNQTLQIEFGTPLSKAEQWIHAKDAPFPEKDSLGLALPLAVAIIEGHGGHLEWVGNDDNKTWVCTLPTTP